MRGHATVLEGHKARNMKIDLRHGDSSEVIKTLADSSIDSVVTDPPYALVSIVKRFGKPGSAEAKHGKDGAYKRASRGFMGKQWDTGDVAFASEFWADVLRVLKPGGHVVAFGATRTYHRLAVAIEDAGFEIRDQIGWLYGSGMCKSHNLKRQPICNCAEIENPLPYDHAPQEPKHKLRPLSQADLSSQIDSIDKRREVLFAGLPQQSAQECRTSGTESEVGNAEQSGMEGRSVRRTKKRICDDFDEESSKGQKKRIRLRTHNRGGKDARPTAKKRGGSAPQESGQIGQQGRKSASVRQPFSTLDQRALSRRGACARCGKLSKAFEGFGTALKPAWEPIVLARKSLIGTVADNVLQHGTGAINIDASRVKYVSDNDKAAAAAAAAQRLATDEPGQVMKNLGKTGFNNPRASLAPYLAGMDKGRWPANIIHDGSDEVVAAFPKTQSLNAVPRVRKPGNVFWFHKDSPYEPYTDSGSAARFFYSAKADSGDRLESKHPTVKPVDLMAYLVRMVTPPGGVVLDPFAGSGSPGMACMREGFNAVLIEREAEYIADIKRRMAHVDGSNSPLFAFTATPIAGETK
jgi:DNA modification methylase